MVFKLETITILNLGSALLWKTRKFAGCIGQYEDSLEIILIELVKSQKRS